MWMRLVQCVCVLHKFFWEPHSQRTIGTSVEKRSDSKTTASSTWIAVCVRMCVRLVVSFHRSPYGIQYIQMHYSIIRNHIRCSCFHTLCVLSLALGRTRWWNKICLATRNSSTFIQIFKGFGALFIRNPTSESISGWKDSAFRLRSTWLISTTVGWDDFLLLNFRNRIQWLFWWAHRFTYTLHIV